MFKALKSSLLAAACVFALTAQAQAETSKTINVPAGDLVAALEELAKQAQINLVYQAAEMQGLRTEGVSGTLTPQQAVAQLLKGTSLRLSTDQATGAMMISADKAAIEASAVRLDRALQLAQAPAQGMRNSPRGIVQSAAESSARAQADERDGKGLEEIIVTAQKRAERLQDVPVPVTALSAASLVNSNQLRVQDYYTRIPGLALNYDGIRSGLPTLAIRGIRTSNAGNPTVGIVVDDLAYGSSTAIGGGGWIPDIDPSDLERVEVLRGPQGTLYGASSMGGLLKFVTVSPSTERLSGSIQGTTSAVRNGDDPGFGLRAAVNIPLSDVLAARISGFTRRDAGYIDNPLTDEQGINETDVEGGRLAVLWNLPGDSELKLSALVQRIAAEGSSNINPALGRAQQDSARNTGWLDRQFEVYDATFTGNFGRATVTAISGYNVNAMKDSVDVTAFFSAYTQQNFGVAAASFDEDVKSEKFSQEIRVAMPVGANLQWLFGAYYADEKARFMSPQYAVDEATGARVAFFGDTFSPTAFEERALFSNVTWQITDRFDLQIGGRYAENAIEASTTSTTAAGTQTTSGLDAQDNVFTYLLTPRLRVSTDLMIYARLASGYRAGGVNLQALLPANADLPRSYQPDETRNYEVGIKAGLFDRAVSLEASIYYIDWQDIQLALVAPGRTAGYMDNGGRATSQGVELSLEAKPFTGLTITAWTTWNDAVLTDDFPFTSSVRGVDGARLPYGSRWSGSVAFDQRFPLGQAMSGSVGASVSYVGDRLGSLRGPAMTSPLPSLPRQGYPSYTRLDLRAGLALESWSLDLFANNVTDERGVLSGGLGAQFPMYFTYIQPRTMGLSLSRSF